jgi:hypothetical protein
VLHLSTKTKKQMKKKKPFLISLTLGLSFFIISCGGGLSGTYSGNGEAFFDKLNFTSGSKVEIYFMGASKEALYEKSGNKVKITIAGENQLFTIDEKGCLDGGGQIGKYCKQ